MRLPRLYRNASLKTSPLQFRLQRVRQEITAQRCHRIVDPVILARIIDPEVLMSVNAHGGRGFQDYPGYQTRRGSDSLR